MSDASKHNPDRDFVRGEFDFNDAGLAVRLDTDPRVGVGLRE